MIDHYLGVDFHAKRSYVVWMDRTGEIRDQRRLPNEEMPAYLDTIPRNTLAVLEATRSWQYMYGILSDKLEKVQLVHPYKVKAIASARIKTDKIDARTLAHLARADLLPTAYVPPPKIREGRDLARHRTKLVRDRTRLKNRVHDILARYGLRSPFRDLFGRSGRSFLEELIPTLGPIHQRMVRDNLALIDQLNDRIAEVSTEIERRAREEPLVQLLKSMPGIGTYSAWVIFTEIGDINRFPSPRQLCSYAGLVPSTYSSDERTYHGHITKQGSSSLRWIMVEATLTASRYSPRLASFYRRVCWRRGKSTARVALARKMLSIIYYMLKRGQVYQEDRGEYRED
jgi:transposase